MSLALPFPPELVEALAKRTAEIVLLETKERSPWMTAEEAAEYLRLPLGRIRNLTAANAIPHRHQGKCVVYHRDELSEWLLDRDDART